MFQDQILDMLLKNIEIYQTYSIAIQLRGYAQIVRNLDLRDQDIVIFAKNVLIDMIIIVLGYQIVLVKGITESLYYF